MLGENIVREFPRALRSLTRRPALSLVAVTVLGLGIGATTAMFSVINVVFLKPLLVREPERLAMVWTDLRDQQLAEAFSSYADYKDWRDNAKTMSGMAAFWSFPNGDVNLTGGTEPQRVSVARITPSFFDVLGITPLHGRSFEESETVLGNHRRAILSYGLWKQHFRGDSALVGRDVQVNGVGYTVVGIMPRELETRALKVLGTDVQLWRPLVPEDNQTGGRGTRRLRVVGRLAPEATIAQAQSELSAISSGLSTTYPETNRNASARLVPVREQVVRDVKTGLMFLLGAVSVVMLGACINVANLMLIRASSRRKQVAVQYALGSTRSRLAVQVLSEGLILGAAGVVTGLFIAFGIVKAFAAYGPADIPLLADVRIDLSVLGFGVLVAMVTVTIASLVPAWRASRADGTALLRQSTTRVRDRDDRKSMKLLTVTQIALAMVLLTAGGLLIRSFESLMHVDPGVNSRGVLTFQVELPMAATAKYPSQYLRDVFFAQLHDRLSSIPGVRATTIASAPPLEEEPSQNTLRLAGDTRATSLQANFRMVGGEYFGLLGIPLLRGRTFATSDVRTASAVVVVSDALARSAWSGEDAIGKRILLGGSEAEVVGVVGDVRTAGLDAEAARIVYMPTSQGTFNFMTVLLRTGQQPGSLTPAVREAVRALDPAIPLHHVRTLDDMVTGSVAQQRFQMLLITTFSALMLVLAVVGTYGVTAYGVSQRTNELGIRSALGASRVQIQRLVIGEGMRLVVIGCVIGTTAVIAFSGTISRFLFGIQAIDWPTLIVVPVLLGAVMLIATLIPARRAARVDPMNALRSEE